ncbi:hypothetical protein [Pectobacterium brasiliense]|uniref:hypothetical protein n=1 Tax=Pectobacterium brasiliense TaxID=180957 RepID=UPI0039876DD7
MDIIIEMITWVNFTKLLTWVSVIASIVGGIYTILVYFRVSGLENKYKVRAMLPSLISQLQDKNKELPNLLHELSNDLKNNKKKSDVSSALYSIKILLENTKTKLESNKKNTTKISPSLSNWLDSVSDNKIQNMLNTRNLDMNKLWGLYSELSSIITHIELINKELGWEKS